MGDLTNGALQLPPIPFPPLPFAVPGGNGGIGPLAAPPGLASAQASIQGATKALADTVNQGVSGIMTIVTAPLTGAQQVVASALALLAAPFGGAGPGAQAAPAEAAAPPTPPSFAGLPFVYTN